MSRFSAISWSTRKVAPGRYEGRVYGVNYGKPSKTLALVYGKTRAQATGAAKRKMMAIKTKRNPSRKLLKEGDPITIKKEWRDKGDEKYLWFMARDENPNTRFIDITYRAKDGSAILAIPTIQQAERSMVTRRRGRTLSQYMRDAWLAPITRRNPLRKVKGQQIRHQWPIAKRIQWTYQGKPWYVRSKGWVIVEGPDTQTGDYYVTTVVQHRDTKQYGRRIAHATKRLAVHAAEKRAQAHRRGLGIPGREEPKTMRRNPDLDSMSAERDEGYYRLPRKGDKVRFWELTRSGRANVRRQREAEVLKREKGYLHIRFRNASGKGFASGVFTTKARKMDIL